MKSFLMKIILTIILLVSSFTISTEVEAAKVYGKGETWTIPNYWEFGIANASYQEPELILGSYLLDPIDH